MWLIFEFEKNVILQGKKYSKLNLKFMMKEENFNIFGSEKTAFLNENGHSLFLKRLLNPNGQHGQGDLFLKRFVKYVLKNPFDETQKWTVEKEKKAGKKGRVDLIVRSKELIIVIENKIGADDQYAQLYRYWRNKIYGEKKPYSEDGYNKSWERGILVYITPDGRKPSNVSKQRPYDTGTKYDGFPNELPMDKITRISYKKDICDWLGNCLHEIDKNENPRLYSILEQYIEWIENYLKV